MLAKIITVLLIAVGFVFQFSGHVSMTEGDGWQIIAVTILAVTLIDFATTGGIELRKIEEAE